MKKYHIETITETKEKQIIDSIICNMCGREFVSVIAGYQHEDKTMEFHHFGGDGGFYSKIGDEIIWHFDLCNECMLKVMAQCKIAPTFVSNQWHLQDNGEWSLQKSMEDKLKKYID
jgi:hypothetical protein